jgi:hypothetical protein
MTADDDEGRARGKTHRLGSFSLDALLLLLPALSRSRANVLCHATALAVNLSCDLRRSLALQTFATPQVLLPAESTGVDHLRPSRSH